MRREGMQGRNRSPVEGMRPGTGRMSPERPFQGPGMYGSGSRSFRRGGGGGYRRAPPKPHFSPYTPPPPPPLRRKTDVLLEAGRLAAEYLVTKGLLPPSSLPPPPPSRWPSNVIGQEFKGRDRDNSVFDGRVSALDRLGGVDGGSGRKRYIDEYDSGGTRNSSRGRKRRMDQYNNVGHGSNDDWRSREKEKNVQWMDRSRNFGDSNGNAYGDDEYDYAPGYRRGGFEDVGDGGSGKASGAVVDGELNYRNEVTGESELDNHDFEDDSVSKASVFGNRKDSTPERDENLQKDVHDGSPSHKETREVKSAKSSSEVGDGDEEMEEKSDNLTISKEQVDLLKSFTSPKVPTRRRSTVGSRVLKFAQASATADTGKDEAQTAMGSVTCSHISVQEPEMDDAENISKDCSSSDKVTDSACSFICSISEKPSVLPVSHSEELESAKSEFALEAKATSGSLPLSEKSFSVQHRSGGNNVIPDPVFDTDSKIYPKSYSFPERSSSAAHNKVDLGHDSGFALNMPPAAKMESESLRHDVSEGTNRTRDWSSPIMLHDYELSNQKKLVSAELFPKIEPGPGMNIKEKKHLLSNSFKICDLNLIHAHDVTEIPDDPVVEHKPTTSLSIDTGDIPTVDFGLSVGHSHNGIGIYDRTSNDNKMIQVIDLEDDSPAEDGQSDRLKPKSEAMYSHLENFLNQTDNAVDLPDIHDGYGLPMSDLLGTDMSSCPAVSGEINGLQQGMSLLEESLPNDDVSMYASFGEIPISFMEPWDPPPQEYGKYF